MHRKTFRKWWFSLNEAKFQTGNFFWYFRVSRNTFRSLSKKLKSTCLNFITWICSTHHKRFSFVSPCIVVVVVFLPPQIYCKSQLNISITALKVSISGVFLFRIFSVFSPNARKYGPEKLNTDTFHAVYWWNVERKDYTAQYHDTI